MSCAARAWRTTLSHQETTLVDMRRLILYNILSLYKIISKYHTTCKHPYNIIRHIIFFKMVIYVILNFNYIYIHSISHLYVAQFINQQIHITQNHHNMSQRQRKRENEKERERKRENERE